MSPRRAGFAISAVVCAALISLDTFAAPTESVAALDPAAIAALRDVSDPQVSPDGELIAYVVTMHVGDGSQTDSDIWIVPALGDKPARLFVPGDDDQASPRWSVDGKRLAYLSTPGAANKNSEAPAEDRRPQIWIATPDGAESRPVTSVDGRIGALAWSHDGKRIAFTMQDAETLEDRLRRERKQDEVVIGRDKPWTRLWMLEVDSGRTRVISTPGLNVSDFDESTDARRFLLRVADTPSIDDFWYRARLIVIDAETGATRATLSAHAGAMPPQWSPDGDRAVLSHVRPSNVVATPRIIDVSTDAFTEVDPDYPGTIWGLEWERGGKSLIGQSLKGTTAFLIRVDARTGKVSPIMPALASWRGMSQSRDGRVLAYLGQSAVQPTEVWVLRGGRARARTQTNPQVQSWRLGEVREVRWPSSRDGRTIHGVLVLPPGYREGSPTRTIVQIHGGPLWAWWSGWLASWHEWAQLLASHGYVVLLPNPRGSEGAGGAFAEASVGDWGGADFQDVLDGLDMLVARRIADPSRVGIGGWSFGGYLSAWAVAHSDRFRAAVVGAAVTDLSSMNGTSDISQGYLPPYIGDRFRDRAEYHERSPVTYADRVRAPVLILHGEADPRVPLSQGLQLYNELRAAGKPVEMVKYPREPHWFRERAHQQDVMERVLAFFDQHLQVHE